MGPLCTIFPSYEFVNYLKVKRFLRDSNWSSKDKNPISIIKHALDRINIRLDMSKEKLHECEDIAKEKNPKLNTEGEKRLEKKEL